MATATQTVVVDNTLPPGTVAAPAAGTAVTGAAVALTTDAVDGTSGILNVQWQWTGATGGAHAIGAAVTNPAGGFARLWNTATGGGRSL